LPIKAISLDK